MAYVAPIHRPSSVRHALRCHVLSAEEESLVLAKANRLEIWRLSEGALALAHSKVINGTISILQKLRPKDSRTDLLFIGTDRFEYFRLAWNPDTLQLDTIDPFKDPGERYMRDSQSQDRCLVDPSGKYLAMHLWEGVLSILRLGNRKNNAMVLEWMDQVRLSELFIKASTFLYTETGHPKIAFLYQSRADSGDAKLATYRLTSDDRDTVASRFDPNRDREIDADIPDPSASMLIPVQKIEEEVKRHNFRNVESAKAHLGGLIVVGETRLLYIDDVTKSTVESPLKEASIFVAWTKYNAKNYFLADDYGNLHVLTISTEGVVVLRMEVIRIGRTSRASNLVYLGNDLLFVASHYGDSQLFKLNLLSDDGTYIQLVQTLPNIGPILDFEIMDLGNRGDDNQLGNEYSSGQARIVTCSGVHKDGSLRSVRSGVGLEDVGILADLEQCRGLFSLRSYGSQKTDTLAVSFLTETRVFRFDPEGEVEEVESFCGMAFDHQTLLARDLPNGQLLQVTTASATLLDTESGVTIASWAPEGERSIVSASANNSWVLLSVDGTELVSLSILNDLLAIKEKDISRQDQIACIHVPPQLPDVGVVGFWTSGTVSLIDLHTLEPIHGESLRTSKDDVSIPRDLALVQILPPHISGPTLFIAMQDGNVVTFNISPTTLTLSNRKRVVLGVRQAHFHLLPTTPHPHDHHSPKQQQQKQQQPRHLQHLRHHRTPLLIHGSENRTVYSAVTADEATYVCPFDSLAFPNCIALATDTQIKIAHIDHERRTHVKPLALGRWRGGLRTPRARRCLAVLGEGKIVAGLTKTVVVCGYEETSSTTGELTLLATYRPATYPAEIAVKGNMIAVADLMKSVSLVEYVPASEDKAGAAPKLVETARHQGAVWATAVGHVEDNTWLEADAQGNLMVLRQNLEGVTAEDRRTMDVLSEINLGEMVNRIRLFEVETAPGAAVVPRAFLGTVEGGIYMFGTVAPDVQDLLLRFQTKLADVIKTTGGVDFRTYRAFRNAEREGDGPFRFLDGELLERFLDVNEATQEIICQGLGPTVEDMRNMVEELRRMH
ncbi:hypothetical protein N0V88_006941 [Collariella sp. IMI 366227]|nr:hypothetical protein N0V88_006941 [Collariella sp. IMI 366227]